MATFFLGLATFFLGMATFILGMATFFVGILKSQIKCSQKNYFLALIKNPKLNVAK